MGGVKLVVWVAQFKVFLQNFMVYGYRLAELIHKKLIKWFTASIEISKCKTIRFLLIKLGS